jgi:penicillin amidase
MPVPRRRRLFRSLAVLLVLATAAALGVFWYAQRAAQVQVDGTMRLAGLRAPVAVFRDELGIPYIFAGNTADLLRAQGFVTAQHRLLQLELFRAQMRGELAAIVGPAALPSDVRVRVLGLRRNADRHVERLSPESRAFFQAYAEGINAYIADHTAEHPLELRLLGVQPTPWSVADLIGFVHFVHYSHAANFSAEIIGQRLVDKLGPERAAEILPLAVNPDGPGTSEPKTAAKPLALALGLDAASLLVAPDPAAPPGLGSNNWAVAPTRSASGRAVFANDPHLDARMLPGYWHPVGLFSPEVGAVGAALPGLPGILSGRTRHVAFGVTNAYGDVQDVYIETLAPGDPDRYLDGGKPVAFEVVTETIRVKDGDAPGGFREERLRIRYTKRGPVISDHRGLGPAGDRVLVLRSTEAEVLAPQIGIEGFLGVPDAAAFDREVQKIDLMMFNFVFADDAGVIGFRASGAVPIRAGRDGALPRIAPEDGSDDWTGFIPKDRMPGALAPERGWAGTANQDTTPEAFPYYYSNYFAPGSRYRRMSDVLGGPGKLAVADHFALMSDARNLQSDRLRPSMIAALRDDPTQRDLATILERWDGVDRTDAAAPLVYQALYREVALGTFADELGPELAKDMLASWYFWQERLDALAATPDSVWFDDVATPDRQETLADVIRAAAPRARTTLVAAQGPDPASWQWGRAHTLDFVSPLRRAGPGRELVGGLSFPWAGSVDTLNRGMYAFNDPYRVNFFPSMRLVVDFGEPEKIEAVVAGGVSERHLQPHLNDQARLLGEHQRRPWWYSREKIEANAKHRVVLEP